MLECLKKFYWKHKRVYTICCQKYFLNKKNSVRCKTRWWFTKYIRKPYNENRYACGWLKKNANDMEEDIEKKDSENLDLLIADSYPYVVSMIYMH